MEPIVSFHAARAALRPDHDYWRDAFIDAQDEVIEAQYKNPELDGAWVHRRTIVLDCIAFLLACGYIVRDARVERKQYRLR
jgi:hypothetical protein